WSGRIYADALVMQAGVTLTRGTVVEFRPGTVCHNAQYFHAVHPLGDEWPIFFNRDNLRPVTLIYEIYGFDLVLEYQFSGAFTLVFHVHGNPDDPTRITFPPPSPTISSIPANPNGNTIELINCDNLILDGVTIQGDPEGRTGTGIYIEKCPSTVRIVNSTISDVETGIGSTLSNARLDSLIIENCSGNGIEWSNDYPEGGKAGRIDNCVIRNNGLNEQDYAGCTFYAASPILACNDFENNNSCAVFALGDAAPSFYDWETANTGANDFSGVGGYPIIRIKEAAPIFAGGMNNFILGECAAYCEELSPTPKTHDLRNNHFEPKAKIEYFFPPDPKFWLFDPQSDPGVCKGEMIPPPPPGGGSKALCDGDLFIGANEPDSARSHYAEAVALSGDTAASGSAALERLANLDPILPPVGLELQKDALFNLSYSFDADSNFDAADSTRDSIMAIANGFDSLRIEYDLCVSELLRSQPEKSGEVDSRQRAADQRHRSILLDRLMGIHHKTSKEPSAVPRVSALHPAYPNPFNPSTTICYDVESAGLVTVEVFDLMGRKVTVLVNQTLSAGSYSVTWDARSVPSGMYFCRMQAGDFVNTKKMVLLR
ncbi:T9SS type A sorting domain-containing protein, partial [bacterium]|nr:T9SS type A sorting domain-containing protein [bacterium]